MQTFEQAANDGKIELLVAGAQGIYVPRTFARAYGGILEPGYAAELRDIGDADGESYWDSWCDILDGAVIVGRSGHKWTLYQDSDLWAIREDADIDWDSVN